MNPVIVHFALSDVVAFQVADLLGGNSMRGEYAGAIPGIVRPELKWTTEYKKLKAAAK
jgi:lipopolysaccharide transport system ATP-binding protein